MWSIQITLSSLVVHTWVKEKVMGNVGLIYIVIEILKTLLCIQSFSKIVQP